MILATILGGVSVILYLLGMVLMREYSESIEEDDISQGREASPDNLDLIFSLLWPYFVIKSLFVKRESDDGE